MVSFENGAMRLICLDSKASGKLKFKFRFGSVSHAIYGTADHLEGEFELCHFGGEYPISNYFSLSQAEQDAILEKIVKRMRHLKEDLDEEDMRKHFLQGLLATVLWFPRLDVHSLGFEVATDVIVISCFSDDLLEGHDYFEDIAYGYRVGISVTAKQVFDYLFCTDAHQRAQMENPIQKLFPDTLPIISALESLVDKIAILTDGGGIPKTYKKAIYASALHGTEGCILSYRGPGPLNLTEKTLMTVRGHDAGMGGIMDMSCFIQKYEVPKAIRQTFLFQLLMTGVREFGGLINDIIGFLKDLDDPSASNVVLRRVVREGISIEQSVTEAVKTLQDIISDLDVVTQRLTAAFPEEKGLAGVIQAAKDLCDGQTVFYVVVSQLRGRYGSIFTEIVPAQTPEK